MEKYVVTLSKDEHDELTALTSKGKHQSNPHQTNILVVGDMTPSSNHQLLSDLEKTMQILPNNYSLTFKPHPGLDVNIKIYPNLMIQKTRQLGLK